MVKHGHAVMRPECDVQTGCHAPTSPVVPNRLVAIMDKSDTPGKLSVFDASDTSDA